MKQDAKKHISDVAFLKQLKSTLDNAAEDIDPATATRLQAIRREAIAQVSKKSAARQLFTSWQWGGAVAATAVVAILLTFNLQNEGTSNGNIASLAALEDLQMLSASDDLEMYQDLEFYQDLELYSRLNEIQKTG